MRTITLIFATLLLTGCATPVSVVDVIRDLDAAKCSMWTVDRIESRGETRTRARCES